MTQGLVSRLDYACVAGSLAGIPGAEVSWLLVNTFHYSAACCMIIFYRWSSFTGPTSVETLTTDDAICLLEELLPAQTHSYLLGLRLGLPVHVVDSIFVAHLHPRDRLLHILIAFLNQEEPRPTWGTVVQALRSPAVSLFQLANKLEATHISDPTATTHNPPTTTTGMPVHFLFCDSANYTLKWNPQKLPPE